MVSKVTRILCTIASAAVLAFADPSAEMPLPSAISDSLPWFAVREIKVPNAPFTRSHLAKAVEKKNRVALVYFATWCIPCRVGVKKLAEHQADLSQNGIQVVLVNLGEKDEKSILSWIEKTGASNFTAIGDPFKRLTEGFGMTSEGSNISLPRTLVLDKNLKPLFMLGQEGSDWPQILWEKN